jgi:hypothetical protein
MFFVKMADQEQEEVAQASKLSEEEGNNVTVRKQLKDFFLKTSSDLRKCVICEKCVKAPQGKHSFIVELEIYFVYFGRFGHRLGIRDEILVGYDIRTNLTWRCSCRSARLRLVLY